MRPGGGGCKMQASQGARTGFLMLHSSPQGRSAACSPLHAARAPTTALGVFLRHGHDMQGGPEPPPNPPVAPAHCRVVLALWLNVRRRDPLPDAHMAPPPPWCCGRSARTQQDPVQESDMTQPAACPATGAASGPGGPDAPPFARTPAAAPASASRTSNELISVVMESQLRYSGCRAHIWRSNRP